jgi:hypothetical protein
MVGCDQHDLATLDAGGDGELVSEPLGHQEEALVVPPSRSWYQASQLRATLVTIGTSRLGSFQVIANCVRSGFRSRIADRSAYRATPSGTRPATSPGS